MVIYVLVYTPLKRFSPLSISIGAIPGAIPFLLGFVAATDEFELAAGTLFAIQFFWQYPHFIAIVWAQEKAYKKAGFKMMFGGEKGKYAASIAIITSVLMTMVSIAAYFYDIPRLTLSTPGAIIILMLGIWFTLKSIKLYIDCKDSSGEEFTTKVSRMANVIHNRTKTMEVQDNPTFPNAFFAIISIYCQVQK